MERKLADGKSVINPNANREGLVFRSSDKGYVKNSFKSISNQYLLKTE